MREPRVAIVDYGMGNLFSVRNACFGVGLHAFVTPDPDAVEAADAIILPGVGAFGDAMLVLESLGMVDALKRVASEGKPLLGICLGLQLLMETSYEFGRHAGIGLIKGDVVPFDAPAEGERKLKVPQVGWNRVVEARAGAWSGTPLEAVDSGVYQYFVHSYYVRPASDDVVLARTSYGDVEFCSAARSGNVIACQFHPERSGAQGMRIFERYAAILRAEA
jgi:imidazole glycerol-phosphate synthase subunit HisH